MRILISNDDGYSSLGIHTLARIMSEFGDVTVVAPKFHQSAMSMSVSLGFKKLAFKPLPEEGPGKWYYLDATPASCVKFGLEYMYESRNPDVVITGINHGTNAGTAANYSATLGAAEEGALNGCRSIGVSVDNFSPNGDLSLVIKYFPRIFKYLMENWPEDSFGLLYNVNFPNVPESELKGVRIARQGRGHWEKEFREWDEEKLMDYYDTPWQKELKPLMPGERAFMMVGDFVDDESGIGDADHRLLKEGWITVTPNNLDRTDYRELKRIRRGLGTDVLDIL
ncbi:MAG: 5'/3'-nucleotidase SurE [Bacteroidales bacterium]|nr:5'/3'-nucleotidase SurE [Bacteroidales bacterium]